MPFYSGVLGAADMVNGIDALVAEGCDVIVDDITYITEPFFEDGIIAQKVNAISGQVAYFTSAGNFGSQSYSATFSPGPSILPGISGAPHVFGTGSSGEDIYKQLKLKDGKYTLVLQWTDGSRNRVYHRC